MGLFDFLKKKTSSANGIVGELPANLQEPYQHFIEVGLADHEATLPLVMVVGPLRGRVEPDLAMRVLDAIFARHASRRLAGVDQSGCARFFDAGADELLRGLVIPALLSSDLDSGLALVLRSASALDTYAAEVGAERADASSPLAPTDCQDVLDLTIVNTLAALTTEALVQREQPLATICDALGIDDLPTLDLTTYFSLLPDAGLAVMMSRPPLMLFSAVQAAKLWAARGPQRASYELLPIALAFPFTLCVDTRGVCGPVGTVYACTEDQIAPMAMGVAHLLGTLPTVQQKLTEATKQMFSA
jgi:hypothetical protein